MPYNPYGNPGYPAPYIPSGTADIAGVTWVSSFDEARNAIVPYGKQLFMHSDDKQFYVKDRSGAIKAFKFEEIPLPSNDPSNFVTKQEFEELRRQYESLVQQQSGTITASPNISEPIAINATDATIQGNTGASQAGVLQQNSGNGAYEVPIEQPVG